MDEERLMTVQEVADRLRVNPYTVRRWLRDGALKGRLLGGKRAGYRIAASDLRHFLAGTGREEGKALAA
jgi:excisionase family DNA binding protein